MRILVTGGAGYIGSHTCKALARAGYGPVVYDNLINGHEWAVKWGPFERGDILDTERLIAVIKKYHPSAVIHFAAFAYVGDSIEHPAKYYHNNIAGTLSLLDAMRATKVDRIVFSSSCTTYGLPLSLPLREDHVQMPINPYGRTKFAIEGALADYSHAYGLRSISLRYFNAAGADPEGEVGEQHCPETHLIPLILQTAAKLRESLTIYGNDYDTPDGTCIRDYVHVSDLANAHLLALKGMEEKPGMSAYNLGIGRGFSVLEVIDVAERVTGQKIHYNIGPRRAGDPPVLYADAKLARQILGWESSYVELPYIVETAWRWMQRAKAVHGSL